MRTRVFEIADAEAGAPVSVNALARRLGLWPSTVWRVKVGQREPNVQFIDAVRAAFPGYSFDELFPPEASEVPA